MSKFLTERLNSLVPYTPGEQPKGQKYIKLNTNESPYPPSKNAIRLAALEAERLMLYSDPECKELRAEMARTLGVGENQVIMTNGSDEVLNFAFMAYCDEKRGAAFADITYGFYKVFAALNSVRYRQIPLKKDFSIDINDYINATETLFIANPNAPTGIALSLSDIEKILASRPERVVVIDEAYVDFGAESAVSLTDKYDNLLVTGTFSKSRSLAGGRLGYGVGCPSLIEDLTRIRYSTNPYNVNRMTAAAGVGALLDKDYFLDNCKKIIKTREWCKERLSELGFEYTDSKANFIFAKHSDIGGEELYLSLKERGILVRHFNSPRIKDYIRITVGSDEEMQTFINIIKEITERKI